MELVLLIKQLRRKKCVLGHTWICFVLVNHSERQPNSKATTDKTTTTEIASTRFGSIYDCHTNHSWLQRVRQTVALAVVHTSLPLPPHSTLLNLPHHLVPPLTNTTNYQLQPFARLYISRGYTQQRQHTTWIADLYSPQRN